MHAVKDEEQPKELSPEEKEAKAAADREEMLKLVNDPNVYANGLTVAQDFEKTFRGNWFDLGKIQKKTKFKDFNQAFDVINILCLLGLCYRKADDQGFVKYKITIDKEARIKLLQENIAEAQLSIKAWTEEIERLQSDDKSN